MIHPIFSTHYSIGRSLLTLESPEKTTPEGAPSLLSIIKDNNLKECYLLEDSFIGFKKALEEIPKLGCQLVFGIRFNICNNRLDDQKVRDESAHKISIFALNDDGCKKLMKLYSQAHTESGGFVDYSLLKEKVDGDLQVVLQFYDSFIHKNAFYGKKCLADLSFCEPIVWLASHGLPVDEVLRRKTVDFAAKNGYPTLETHHVFYEKSSDVEAIQVMKIITNRKAGKAQTLDRPELSNFGSDEFSWQSYKEKIQ